MTLIRNIIMVLAAMFVLGVAGQASAKTLTEVVACRDAGFAAAPFTGTTAHKERQAKSLAIGTKVLVNGVSAPLSAGQSLWSLCEGPSLKEQLATVKAELKASKHEVSRLTAANTSLRDTLAATKAELVTAQAEAKSEHSSGMLWLALLLCISIVLICMLWLIARLIGNGDRLQRRLDALKSAPPETEASALGNVHPTAPGGARSSN